MRPVHTHTHTLTGAGPHGHYIEAVLAKKKEKLHNSISVSGTALVDVATLCDAVRPPSGLESVSENRRRQQKFCVCGSG